MPCNDVRAPRHWCMELDFWRRHLQFSFFSVIPGSSTCKDAFVLFNLTHYSHEACCYYEYCFGCNSIVALSSGAGLSSSVLALLAEWQDGAPNNFQNDVLAMVRATSFGARSLCRCMAAQKTQ